MVEDPCGCDNIIAANNAFGFLFVDVLTITGSPATVTLTTNNSGFLDATGTPFLDAGAITLGVLPPDIQFTFYRPPNVVMKIVTSVGSITSPACTQTCPRVPTLSQWGILSLAILLLIFGITAIRERKAG